MLNRKTSYDPEKKVWSGQEIPPIFNPNSSIGSIIFRTISTNLKNIIQINDTERTELTNKQLIHMSSKVAVKLESLGLKQDDVVGIIASNTTYLMPVAVGCFFANIPFHPLDTSFDKNTISHLWGITRPKVIFCDGDVLKIARDVSFDLKLNSTIYTLNDHEEKTSIEDIWKEDYSNYCPSSVIDSNQTAVIYSSSGSTGLPKAVALSHRYIITFILSMCSDSSEDVSLLVSSFYWITGFIAILNSAVTGATNLIARSPFSPSNFISLIEKYKVTRTDLTPAQVALIIDCPSIQTGNLKSLRNINLGGATFPKQLRFRFRKYLSEKCIIIFDFGTTELAYISESYSDESPDSTGSLCPNVKVKIIDSNGENLGVRETGEICAHGSIPWAGYIRNQTATDDVYDPQEFWYRTGDIGYFDNEGNLYVIDRLKDVIKVTDGHHVSPSEIESIILEIPCVVMACVVGITDVKEFNTLVALVVKSESSSLSKSDVINFVNTKTSEYKRLKDVYFVDRLPMTSTGKVVRKMAINLAEEIRKRVYD
ncbi:hypothetical protein ACFFRR_004481 [Megaselia abdita]